MSLENDDPRKALERSCEAAVMRGSSFFLKKEKTKKPAPTQSVMRADLLINEK